MSINRNSLVARCYRWLRYGDERRKWWREIRIRSEQDSRLASGRDLNAEGLIVFLVPGADLATGKDKISGGVISIVSLCAETTELRQVHQSETMLCTLDEDHLFLRHERFDNNIDVFRISQVERFSNLSRLIIHVPEFMVSAFLESPSAGQLKRRDGAIDLHVNILNQNIQLMPDGRVLGALRRWAAKLTMTTAHAKYCTRSYRESFGIPLHKLSVWISPEQYAFRGFDEKKKLVVVSPDQHPMRKEIIDMIQRQGEFEVRVIQGISYSTYKQWISEAMFSITFGEGLDGYFIEPVFSGAVSFAVYNQEFFTDDFEGLSTVYHTYEQMRDTILGDIRRLSAPGAFGPVQQQLFDICARYYNAGVYRNNIELFYKGELTYP